MTPKSHFLKNIHLWITRQNEYVFNPTVTALRYRPLYPVDFVYEYHLTVSMTGQVQSPLKEHYKRSHSEVSSVLTSSSYLESYWRKGDSVKCACFFFKKKDRSSWKNGFLQIDLI